MKQFRDYREAVEEAYIDSHDDDGCIDFKKLCAVIHPIPKQNDYWGRWVYDEKYFLIYYNPEEGKSGYRYEIDLEKINNMNDINHWMIHMTESKNWIEPEDIGNLFRAFYDIFDRLRSTVCSEDFNSRQFLRQRRRDRKAIEAKKATL